MSGKRYSDEEEVPKAFRKEANKSKKKKGKGLKIFIIILLILLILIAGILGGAFWFVNNKFSKMQQIEINEEELNVSVQAEENLSEYRNIAIFGVDSRNNNLEKGNRSDCIIIASLNNKTGDIKLISVYRDTYVNIEGYGLDKITHAYSYGSAPLAIKTLNTNLDLNIKEFITVNFDAVAEAVDKLGGVQINIESQEELKHLNSYIDETAKVTGNSATKLTRTGIQTLNGVQAVSYSRIRYTVGGDSKRTERMRTVIEAMMAKVKTLSIGQINSFVDFMLPKVYTNITGGDIISLLPNVANFKIGNSIGWPYETKGITLDRWYGVPVTLESNVRKMHTEIFNVENYEPTQEIKNISNKIITKTGYGK